MLKRNIRSLRKARGWTQEDLALKLNVSRQTVFEWERRKAVPDAERLLRLAEEFEVPVSTLLGEAAVPSEQENTVEALSAQLARINEQIDKRKEQQRKLLRGLSIAGLVVVLVLLLFEAAIAIYANSLAGGVGGSASIGIIGGADGPTAVFVSSSGAEFRNILIAAAVLLLCGCGLYFTKK